MDVSTDSEWMVVLQYATALCGSGSFLAVISKLALDTLRCRQAKKTANIFQQFGEIYKTLERIQEQMRAVRTCIVKLENGGGIPEPGGAVKSSIIYEISKKGAGELASQWKNIPLDGVWARLVQDVIKGPSVEISGTQDVSRENAFLAADEYCDKVIFVSIAVRKTAFYFLSVHLTKDVEPTDEEQRSLSAHTFRLRSIFGR